MGFIYAGRSEPKVTERTCPSLEDMQLKMIEKLLASFAGDQHLWHTAWLQAGPTCSDANCYVVPYDGLIGSCSVSQDFDAIKQIARVRRCP
eukprot:271872-Amphidinium_carterae.1